MSFFVGQCLDSSSTIEVCRLNAITNGRARTNPPSTVTYRHDLGSEFRRKCLFIGSQVDCLDYIQRIPDPLSARRGRGAASALTGAFLTNTKRQTKRQAASPPRVNESDSDDRSMAGASDVVSLTTHSVPRRNPTASPARHTAAASSRARPAKAARISAVPTTTTTPPARRNVGFTPMPAVPLLLNQLKPVVEATRSNVIRLGERIGKVEDNQQGMIDTLNFIKNNMPMAPVASRTVRAFFPADIVSQYSLTVTSDNTFYRELIDALFYETSEYLIPLQKRNLAKMAYARETFFSLRCRHRDDLATKLAAARKMFNFNTNRRINSTSYEVQKPGLICFMDEQAAIDEANEQEIGDGEDGEERDALERDDESGGARGSRSNLTLSDIDSEFMRSG